MKAVSIAMLGAVRPLLSDTSDLVVCTQCQQAPARWELGEVGKPALHFVCSLCFLYELGPMKAQREAIDVLVAQVEGFTHSRFALDERRRLQSPSDADRIVYGIVAAGRYEASRGLE